MKVRIEFERLGRDHNPEPLDVEVAAWPDGGVNLGSIQTVVYEHARRHLVSRDVEVFVERETEVNGDPLAGNPFWGTVYAGFHVAGEFKGREVTE